MEKTVESLVRESERLQMVTEFVKKCINSQYQVIDKEMLCFLLGLEYEERRIDFDGIQKIEG